MKNVDLYKNNVTDLQEYAQLKYKFDTALEVVDDIVLKKYITKLKDLDIIPFNEKEHFNNISENVRIFKIDEMVYEKDEYSTYKFASVFNALATIECSVFIIIDSNGEKTNFYMGIRSCDFERTTNSIKDTLKYAMHGQFPGIKTTDFFYEETKEIIKKIKGNNISIVSSVANNKNDNNENKSFIQGLEKLALSMQGQSYTGIILANSTTNNDLLGIRKSYENIYTQLSPFASSQISYATNNSINVSEALSNGTTTGTSYTSNKSETNGESFTKTDSTSDSISKESKKSKMLKGLSLVASVVGTVTTPFTGGLSLVGTSVFLNAIGSLQQENETIGTSKSDSYGTNSSQTFGESIGKNNSFNTSKTNTSGITNGESKTIGITIEDKTIASTLKRIDGQLERLNEFESLGMWECAAYFLGDDSATTEIAAATYKAIMRGENSGIEVSAINSWKNIDSSKVKQIEKYVTNFIHPIFKYDSKSTGTIEITPCSLVSGNELALHMGLPRKSVSGFPVIEHADFGKEVVSYNKQKSNSIINLGNIFNMGSEYKKRVELDRNSLSMHTFVTGSTGSGKSNVVYELLDQLDNVEVKFLIIEPAKGEYKNVFGNRKNVKVLGTNPRYSELLKINPFKFPEKIHILEHIDRLIEIFNVCWPMYAAMPAVLKEAILESYRECGWDLVNSINDYSNNIYPTFSDLQIQLVNVVEASGYSQELKSNYIGALETRIKTLTNGLNGQIFSATEVDNNILFDSNVIVDLSRVGSLETKSLMMGILIMRLNEHRMAFANGMNIKLRHVTVLEEAHNILKKSSSGQDEGGSVLGKSVEMLTNSIAEMRTYGEGFIIVDQSPNSVDISAIRNTNTKIIMRLPDEADRRLVGKAAALKDEQLDEITKFPKGVGVVYQNDWLEPVLCKIKKYSKEESVYEYENNEKISANCNKLLSTQMIKLLLKKRIDENIDINTDYINELIEKSDIAMKNKIKFSSYVSEYSKNKNLKIWDIEKFDELSIAVTEVLESKSNVERVLKISRDFNDLTKKLSKLVEEKTEDFSEKFILSICQCLIKEYSLENKDGLEIYAMWREKIDYGVK